VQVAPGMLYLAKAVELVAEEDLLELKVVVIIGGALLAVDGRPHAASLAHVALYYTLTAAVVVLELWRLFYVIGAWLRLRALIHVLLHYGILHKLWPNVGCLLLVSVDKVADFAEAEFHRVPGQRARLVGEHVAYLAQLLIDRAC
jgi:hypothetical protein